jgi:putative flippase GtrA
VRRFIKFTFISGLGWICDFLSFIVFVQIFNISGRSANFLSSYVGVTFVWFTSLRVVFGGLTASNYRYLIYYCGLQLVSITAYSQILHLVFEGGLGHELLPKLSSYPFIAAKVIITPFNLITNFLLMKWLSRFMQQATPA